MPKIFRLPMHILNSNPVLTESSLLSQSTDKLTSDSENIRFVAPHSNWLESLVLNKDEGAISVPLKRIADINDSQPSLNELDPIQLFRV